MKKESPDRWGIIVRLAEEELGVSRMAVQKWRQRQVPHKWRPLLLDAAAIRNVSLSREDFEELERGTAA